MLEFEGEVLKTEKYPNAAFFLVHGDIKKMFGRANPKVKAEFNGLLYRGTIANMGMGPIIIMPKAIREKLGVVHGDMVHVKIELDTEERVVEVPALLYRELEKHGLLDAFEILSYPNRKELSRSISEAKREETKVKRLIKAIEFVRGKSKI